MCIPFTHKWKTTKVEEMTVSRRNDNSIVAWIVRHMLVCEKCGKVNVTVHRTNI
jgi:hypothetical protein